jgi:hypothetical protein
MAAKTKCPACGAKNPVDKYRCRLCTAVINPEAAAPVEEAPPTPVGVDHFDAGDINRQLQPVRERISSGNGALSARLAAARGTSTAPSAEVVPSDPDLTFDPAYADPVPPASTTSTTSAPTAAPIEYDDEPFDPDALFRDMS